MSPRLRVPPGVLRGGALGLGLLLAASGLTGWLDVLARLACGATFAWAKQLPLPLVLGASAADLPLAPLAWDAAHEISQVLRFEGEVVVCWDAYGYGYEHSYCLVFTAL